MNSSILYNHVKQAGADKQRFDVTERFQLSRAFSLGKR